MIATAVVYLLDPEPSAPLTAALESVGQRSGLMKIFW
jgi:hypothetical protein